MERTPKEVRADVAARDLGECIPGFSSFQNFSFSVREFISRCIMAAVTPKQKVVVVGAGPVGSLAALYAASRGDEVEVYELRGGTYQFQLFWSHCPLSIATRKRAKEPKHLRARDTGWWCCFMPTDRYCKIYNSRLLSSYDFLRESIGRMPSVLVILSLRSSQSRIFPKKSQITFYLPGRSP